MAGNNKRGVVLTQKAHNNTRAVPSNHKQKVNLIPQMSPEARRALGMVRDDLKENIKTSPYEKMYENKNNVQDNGGAILDGNNNVHNRGSTFQPEVLTTNNMGQQRRIHPSNARVHRLPPRHNNRKASISRGAANNTARSRSTLSHTDPPFSASDNTESCYQTASSASVYTNNNSNSYSGNINSDSNNRLGKAAVGAAGDEDADDYDDADGDENDDIGSLPIEQDVSNGNPPPDREKSFVRALDRALELKFVSRLKGDITDTTRIHQPGTVRALDGGRLANAQEVVVNVCHNDDKQLVFHDDDEESLDSAKEISQIRVNIWMEYNSSFPPDNDINDFHPPDIPDDTSSSPASKSKTSSSGTLTRSSGGEKTSTGSRKYQDGREGKLTGVADRNGNSTISTNSRNINVNVNDKTNRNRQPVSTARPRTSVPKSVRSGSSGSSREPSQNGASSKKRVPVVNPRIKR